MADTTFVSGTTITSPWLNDVNRLVYEVEQADAGAVARSGIDKLNDVLSVKDFGAVGGGVTNDYTAILAAINAAIARGVPTTVWFPTDVYKCGTAFGTFFGSDITIDLNGSTLDFSSISAASTSTLLGFYGTYDGNPVALTSTAAADQKTIAIDSSSFSVGDFVRVYSEKVFDPARTDAKYGELNFVETIPGGTSLTTTMELQASYTTGDTAMVEILNPVRNITIKNGKIIGPSATDDMTRGLRFRVAINCQIQNISISGIDYAQMQLTDCIDCTVSGCHFDSSHHTDTAYGLSFADACCDCIAYGNTFSDVRHSLSTNNNSSSYGIVRRIRFESNDIRDSSPAILGPGGDAIDTHAGAEQIDIINNTVHSSSGVGINVEARSARIIGNRVKHTTSVGIYFHPYSDQVSSATINDNHCNVIGDGSGTDPGIYVLGTITDISRLTIVGNHVESATSSGIRVDGGASSLVRYLTLTGNTVRTTTGSQIILLTKITSGTVTGNSGLGVAAVGGIYADTCNQLGIIGNTIEIQGTATDGYGVRFVGTGTRNLANSNIIINGGTFTNAYGVHLAGGITYTGVYGNNIPAATAAVTLGAGAGNAQANNL